MSWKTICWEAILLGFLFSCTGSDKDPMEVVVEWKRDKRSYYERFGSDEIPEFPGSDDL